MTLPVPESIVRVAKAVAEAGGRALLVGGSVRDGLLGLDPGGDADVEIFGIDLEGTEALLGAFGEVVHVGRAFGVLMVKGIDADFSLPRRDSKVAPGHRGFRVDYAPELDFAEAARRRDLTINSMGYDPLTGEILDPFHGRDDLAAGVLRATDPAHFPEDPLRGLRVAAFAARLEMAPDDELLKLSSELDLSELSAERVFGELGKALRLPARPSIAFRFLQRTTLLRFFPEVEALVNVAQDPLWHPEGDVWTHTLMVLDEAAKLRQDDAEALPLMYGALCHDFGKPSTTTRAKGRIRSNGHDVAGVRITERFLRRLRAPKELVAQVGALVRHHLAPGLYPQNGAKPRAYRRLARELEASGVSMELLLKVATADFFGRTTREARARDFASGRAFREEMEALAVEEHAPRDAVRGRHLVARGFPPGPAFAKILERCRDVQDETGWDDPERILDEALKRKGGPKT